MRPAGDITGRSGAASPRPLYGLLLLMAVALVALAVTRRLNFDEALALRAGWLLIGGVPGEPSFLMPTTLVLGAAATVVTDPGWLFVLLRLGVAGAVLPLLWWSWRIDADRATAALAGVVTLSNATFVVHALEFRYDAALLAGWIAGYGLVRRRRRGDFFLLGLCVAWLGAHHLKGALFAVALLALAAAAARLERGSSGARIGRLGAGLAAGTLTWVLVAAALGKLPQLAEVYTTFFDLAATTGDKLWPWDALGETVRRDAVWWLVALGAALVALGRRRQWAAASFDDPLSWDLAFALLPLAFLFLHPHPWAYQTAPAAPFLGILVARTLRRLRPRLGWALGGATALVALQLFLTGTTPWTAYRSAASAPMGNQVDTLRRLRAAADSGDRVIDPSGLAYFLRPCVGQWYLDTLFRARAERGAWMAELATIDLSRCSWMLNTYRLRMLPEPLQERLRGGYALLPGSGGLALHRADPRLAALAAAEPLRHDELFSFW